MYKLKPGNDAEQATCEQFKASLTPEIEAQFGASQGEITPGEPTWQTDGLWISLSARWFEEANRCSAEVFVRATDLSHQ